MKRSVNIEAFRRELARIAALHLSRIAPQDRALGMVQLQEATSLYQPGVEDLIVRLLRQHDARKGR